MRETYDVSQKAKLLGGEVYLSVEDPDPKKAKRGLVKAFFEIRRLQKIFDVFDPASELSRLNNERSITASEDLLYVIKASLKYAEKSKGVFDVTLGRQIAAAKSFIRVGKVFTKPKKSPTGYDAINLKGNQIVIANRHAVA